MVWSLSLQRDIGLTPGFAGLTFLREVLPPGWAENPVFPTPQPEKIKGNAEYQEFLLFAKGDEYRAERSVSRTHRSFARDESAAGKGRKGR